MENRAKNFLRVTATIGLLGCLVWAGVPAQAYRQEIRGVAKVIAGNLEERGKKTIAVVDFTDLQGNITELGRFIAEELSAALADEGGHLEVVDRAHLKSLLEEHSLSSTGLIDPETTRQVGKIAGVEALVTGSITPFGDSVRIVIKVLDTDTARIVLSETVDMGKTPAVEELLRREVESPRSVRNGSSLSESRAADTLIAGQFRYELMSCVHQGDSVRCTLRVTNLIEDRNFGITKNDGRIIGDDGLEYWSSGVAVGSEQGQWFVNRILPRDVPVMAFVWFGRVSQPPRRIAVLEIKVNGGMLAFRDVTLGK